MLDDTKTFRVTEAVCPFCEYNLNAASDMLDQDTHGPTDGDVTICIKCAGLLVFEGDPLHLRAPTRDELDELITNDKRLVVLVGAARLNQQRIKTGEQ